MSCGTSFRDSEHPPPGESETLRVMSVHSASDREMGWQDLQCAARSPTAIWAPVSDTVETINLQLTSEPSWGFRVFSFCFVQRVIQDSFRETCVGAGKCSVNYVLVKSPSGQYSSCLTKYQGYLSDQLLQGQNAAH